jgi:hypothetical protein
MVWKSQMLDEPGGLSFAFIANRLAKKVVCCSELHFHPQKLESLRDELEERWAIREY